LSHDLHMVADAFIQCRVPAEMKALIHALAEREQISESTLIKQLLAVVLRTGALNAPPIVEVSNKPNRDARLYVRLRPEDRILLRDRAAARGMAPATYVSVLVRAHLRSLAPLPKQELTALNRSVAELGAIGRNLNQIARAANQGSRVAGPAPGDLLAILKACETLRSHVKSIIKGNVDSWETGHAED
jgi:hypothetical protein